MENGSENVEVRNSSHKVEIDAAVSKKFNDKNINDKKKKKKNKRGSRTLVIFRKFRCIRSGGDYSKDVDGGFDVGAAADGKLPAPSHLVVMVNGIIGSAQNWRYAAKQLVKAYPQDVIVHCSDANSNMLTFDGVDVMGKRLADEVVSVIRRHPNLQKISFVGHSLGGLVARCAISRLYEKEDPHKVSEGNGECRDDHPDGSNPEEQANGRIAGLRPVNFITSATPHLGSRGHKQVPMFCGSHMLERVAMNSSWLLGRTGKHLFLTDSDDGKPPLLLQMANDTEDSKFISALRSFSRRVAYANASFDQIVGWSTSSLRRPSELPKCRHSPWSDKYPHVMNVESAETSGMRGDISKQVESNGGKRSDIEEAMIRGLTRLSWERIDVNFRRSKQRYLAHSTIQVKTKYLNSDGADVIQHMVDNFRL